MQEFVALKVGVADLVRRRIECDGATPVRLTAREALLLGYLVDTSPRVVSREELLVEVWGARPDLRTRTVEVTVHNLRRKVEARPRAPEQLLTVRGEGYRWVPFERTASTALRSVFDGLVLPHGARSLVARALARTLWVDDPESALSVLLEGVRERPAWAEQAGLLLDLGRLDEASTLLAELDDAAFERAILAFRLGDEATRDTQLRLALQHPEQRGRALLRFGVDHLDRGRLEDGFEALNDAGAWGRQNGDPLVEAVAHLEEAMYRALQGRFEAAHAAVHRSLVAGSLCGSVFVERLNRTVLAFVLRATGDPEGAERERAAVETLTCSRLEEPGVFLFRALERRLAGDRRTAEHHLEEGVARHRERPNPPDVACVRALQASWAGGTDAGSLDRASPFVTTQIRGAWGNPLERALGVESDARVLELFGPWPKALHPTG